ncbi:MAG TPA: cupin domain-containing protein [Alphaproteobacteria bacterium]|nr:cupin domain-containing protein [Alphaproteobacteria bacterium]
MPIALRGNSETGCWVTATKSLGILPDEPLYWYIDRFPDRRSAAGEKGTIVESYGRTWLFNIAGEGLPKAESAERVAVIGPLPVNKGHEYTAAYMEGTMRPGEKSLVHRHPGTEVFYNLEGEMCLETPGKKSVVEPGESLFVAEGVPMELTVIGQTVRRSLVLILHHGHWIGTPAFDWKPEGLCDRAS